MTIELTPEDQALVEERLRSGAFHSVGDVIHCALVSLPAVEPTSVSQTNKNLVELFAGSPLKGIDLKVEREPDYGRDIEL